MALHRAARRPVVPLLHHQRQLQPTQPLTRAELASTPFLDIPWDGTQVPGEETFHGTLPAGRHGRALILAIWDIADTGNAFYSCDDVQF